MVVILTSLRNWWRSFDAFGRRFINDANPIMGSSASERKMIAEAKRQQEARENING